MQSLTTLLSLVVWTLSFASRIHESVATPSQDYLPQGFFFDWNPPGTTVPIPITQQCDTLHITWERGSAGAGPNPTSPYFLQIFTSTFVVPIVVPAGSGTSFDFQVPWTPNTQYQICMWDSKGVSGGCQDIYTVIPNPNATAVNPSNCQNVTYPSTVLSVDAAVINGAFSQYGWVPQCTDIQVEAKNGTPPYTLVVAPTLHTPLNITKSSGPINYTVTLSHGIPFFISVTDSQGYGWAQGPLHSGDNADTSCLDIHHSASGNSSTNIPVTVGATVGGVVVGLLAGAIGLFTSRRLRSSHVRHEVMMRDSGSTSSHPQPSREVMTAGGRPVGSGLEYIVEPFAMPTASSDPTVPLIPGSVPSSASPPDATSATGSDPQEQSATSAGRRQNVYVVHHDGGRAPVTVYTEEGAEVVELPPRYPAGSTSEPSSRGGSETAPTRESSQRREPGTVPRKARGPRSPP